MVAVGIWGAQLGAPAVWLLPVVFPLVMAFGGMAGVITGPLPGVDLGVALSAIVLGALVAREQRLPMWAAVPIIALFAVSHGHTHGAVLPDYGVPILFASGFVISTGLLHLCGILLGLLLRVPRGRVIIRGSGGVIALVGFYFFVAYLSV
jgi:urease accessory protein